MSANANNHDRVQLYKQNVPRELQYSKDGWFVYDFDSNNPRAPRLTDGRKASWSDEDGLSFDRAINTLEKIDRFDAIGYRFEESDPFFYIDWDNAVEKPRDCDSQKDWCPSIQTFATITYTEWSSSGTGAHTIFEGQIPDWWEDASMGEHEGVEIFDSRMCIFTGRVIDRERIKHADEVEELTGETLEDVLLQTYEKIEGEAPSELQESPEEVTNDEIVQEYEGEVFEALQEIDPREIEDVLWSDYQGDRQGGVFQEWNPDYRRSKSGTALIHNTETGSWFDFKSNDDGTDEDKLFGTLELFAAERGRIESPIDELSGEDWVNAYKNFRDKCQNVGVELPSLEDNRSVDVGRNLDWEEIRSQYAKSQNETEKGKCAVNAALKLLDDDDWLKVMGEDSLMHYDEGVFREDRDKDLFQNKVNEGLIWEYSRRRKNRIYDMLVSRCSIDEDELGCNEGLVVVENGTLDVIERRLHDWSPEYNATHKIPVRYNPDADDPEVFFEFLDDVLVSEQDREKVQEFFGYTLMHWGLPYHKSLFCVGPTNSGKSTLLDILAMMHDDDAVAGITPQQMSHNRFDSQMLEDAWVNIRNDIDSATVENVGFFKEVIAGDEVKVEKKGQDPYYINPTAKHAFAGNQLPTASVDDSAFYQRVLLLALPRTIPREEQDKRLLRKVQREMSGVLNWALDGLHRLMNQGHFTGDRSARETEQMWQNWSSSVKRFIHECLRVTKDEEDVIAKEAVMDTFRLYTDAREMPSASKKTLTQTITSKAGVTHSSYGGTDGSGEYLGVEFNETGERIFQELDKEDPDLQELQELFE